MTTHYIDIRVIPNPEASPSQLLGALYDHLHLALVQQRRNDVGVSFPGYSRNPRTLGNVLRLHGHDDTLQQFIQTDWLRGMRDHVHLSALAVVPHDARHRTVQRKQFKTSAERLRRRRMHRKGETAEQAKAAIPSSVGQRPDLPYIHLHSHSTRQSFCLFIELGQPTQHAQPGTFNSYGLSGTTTVPWF